MYSTSRCTRFFVRVVLITCFDRYFMATVWPVTVCMPTTRHHYSLGQSQATQDVLFTFPNVPSAISFMTLYSPSFDAGSASTSSDMIGDGRAGWTVWGKLETR